MPKNSLFNNHRLSSIRHQSIGFILPFLLILCSCSALQQGESQKGGDANDLSDLEKAHSNYLGLAQAGDVSAMNNLGVIEARRGNPEEAKKWYSWAALLGSESAAGNLYANGDPRPKSLILGVPLGDNMLACDVLLDSIYVLPELMALRFKVQNLYSHSTTSFSVNAVATDRESAPYLHGVVRNNQTPISASGYRLFSAMVGNTTSEVSVSITCGRDTDIVHVPLDGPRVRAAIDSFGNQPSPAGTNEVRIFKVGGVYEVPVELNGVLKIRMIIDSGASEVLISPDVASTLYRARTISTSDWLPGRTYRLADGSTTESDRFILRQVKIGNRTITGVPCAISSELSAPMLLGQSVLERLGKYAFDYDRSVIVFQ